MSKAKPATKTNAAPATKPKPYTGSSKRRPRRQTSASTNSATTNSATTSILPPNSNSTIEPFKLELNCIVEGEQSSFPVEIFSNKSIGNLKDSIYPKIQTPDGVLSKDLILNVIPNGGVTKKGLGKLSKRSLVPFDDELEKLHIYFPTAVDETRIHILVQLPQQVQKRGLDEDETASGAFKRTKISSDKLIAAIEVAKLGEKAIGNGTANLSKLTSNELIMVLDKIGTNATELSDFTSVSRTAGALRGISFHNLDVISSPQGTRLPVTDTRDMYVRPSYKDFYNEIDNEFGIEGVDGEDVEVDRQVTLSGTPGIGKSSFLIYFIIRVLATSSEDSPPIIICQEKESTNCYAFGGLNTVRKGCYDDFLPFLELTRTWYLVDSSPTPRTPKARTIISASPKTLFSEEGLYQEIAKRIEWTYYMAPWTEEELKVCRESVKAFNIVPERFMLELFELIGGVPRYVLEKPKKSLKPRRNDPKDPKDPHSLVLERAYSKILEVGDLEVDDPKVDISDSEDNDSDDGDSRDDDSRDDDSKDSDTDDSDSDVNNDLDVSNDPEVFTSASLKVLKQRLERARVAAYSRVKQAIDLVKNPHRLLQYFEQARESLQHSGRLLHRWPTEDHRGYRLEWASIHIRDEVERIAIEGSYQEIASRLIDSDSLGEARGAMFELYVRHIFRQGGIKFNTRELQAANNTSDIPNEFPVEIPINPPAKVFSKIEREAVSGTLYIPRSKSFPCVDLLLAPNILLQITVDHDHPIKGKPCENLIGDLVENGWIKSVEEIYFIFIVPKVSAETYKKQNFLKADKKTMKRVRKPLKDIRQYVLGIDLEAAAKGRSPDGLDKGSGNDTQTLEDDQDT
ncbi:hypothetical protein BGZ76_002369 [Entomortierella beljakovae]|nr:hypothetical protein BGZ76_002369 [Entomortierella beljakovae]